MHHFRLLKFAMAALIPAALSFGPTGVLAQAPPATTSPPATPPPATPAPATPAPAAPAPAAARPPPTPTSAPPRPPRHTAGCRAGAGSDATRRRAGADRRPV